LRRRVRKMKKRKGMNEREQKREVQGWSKSGAPPPVFSVSVASKGFSWTVSLLFAIVTERSVSVASKAFSVGSRQGNTE
jgi:hypothetical protein